jgi:methylated-DNA-[protein]-cysteine S-methyltransferase
MENERRMNYSRMESPIGLLTIAADEEGLHSIEFGDGIHVPPDAQWSDSGLVHEVIRQLQGYFNRKLFEFTVPLKPEGTSFQKDVWRELLKIPYGTVISYGELARRIGNPKASRAVGAANGSNPIPIIIPCHRVIGGNGKMTGYAGGLAIKEGLLKLEKSRLF